MPSRVYCTLAEVKRLLRSVGSREGKVRFSDAFKDKTTNSDNSGTVVLDGVSFLSSYADHEVFTFTYTDATSFDVIGDMSGTIGSSNRLETFTASGKFSVDSTNWDGGSLSGDIVYITANSDISDDDGDAFVTDGTRFINAYLAKSFGEIGNVPFIADATLDVPDEIVYACIRYTAYEIFHSIFAGATFEEGSPVEKWKAMADEALHAYVSGKGEGPRWMARNGLLTEVGVKGVGEGVIVTEPITNNPNKDFDR